MFAGGGCCWWEGRGEGWRGAMVGEAEWTRRGAEWAAVIMHIINNIITRSIPSPSFNRLHHKNRRPLHDNQHIITISILQIPTIMEQLLHQNKTPPPRAIQNPKQRHKPIFNWIPMPQKEWKDFFKFKITQFNIINYALWYVTKTIILELHCCAIN